MLANDPQLILADEPTGNLDPATTSMVLEFFEQFINEGRTIVMVTHDPKAAERARRKLHIDGGHVVEDNQSIVKRVVA
jgi:putative ABC transport system ATP-binding protein